MSEPFVGEVRMFAGNFAPRGWAFCDGQLMSVSQNDALFSLLGTIYGGDGRTTFGLPDLRGRIPIHPGTGPGLSARKLGAKAGAENVTLTTQQLGQHSHTFEAVSTNATASAPTTSSTLAASVGYDLYVPNGSVTAMASQAMAVSGGGGQSHTNVMPFLCVNFIMALVGNYPSRN